MDCPSVASLSDPNDQSKDWCGPGNFNCDDGAILAYQECTCTGGRNEGMKVACCTNPGGGNAPSYTNWRLTLPSCPTGGYQSYKYVYEYTTFGMKGDRSANTFKTNICGQQKVTSYGDLVYGTATCDIVNNAVITSPRGFTGRLSFAYMPPVGSAIGSAQSAAPAIPADASPSTGAGGLFSPLVFGILLGFLLGAVVFNYKNKLQERWVSHWAGYERIPDADFASSIPAEVGDEKSDLESAVSRSVYG